MNTRTFTFLSENDHPWLIQTPPGTPWLMVGSGYQMTPGPCHGARLVETLPDRDVSVLTGGLPGVQELGRWSLQLPEIQVLNGETNKYQWGYHSIKMSLSFHKKWVDGHNCDGPPEVSELPVVFLGLGDLLTTKWPGDLKLHGGDVEGEHDI